MLGGGYNPEELRDELGIPDKYILKLVIAVGKSAEEIHLVEIEDGGDTGYYRDADDVHYVPKRKLEDVILR